MSKSCPACADDGRRTSHSGADIDFVREAIPGGEVLWSAKEGVWPSVDLVRCKKCGQLWIARHDWPDRPPYMCTLTRATQAEADLATGGGVDGFLGLVKRGHTQLRGLPLGVALNADEATRKAIRAHPEFPAGMTDHWDRLVGWGTL